MKTLLKNRRVYKNRIGSLDKHDKHQISKDNDGEEDKDENYGNDSDWESMYMPVDKENQDGGKDIIGGEDGGDYRIGSEDEDEDEDSGKDIIGGEVGGEDGIGSEDEDGGKDGGEDGIGGEDEDGGKDINGGVDGGEDGSGGGSRSVKQAGVKRKQTRDIDDEPATATRSKRKKMDGSGAHQAPIQLTKKAPPKRRTSKK
jgi:hypothetical protein